MFETGWQHPYIFVGCRRTSRLQFFVGDDGMLEHEGARLDLGNTRRIAIAYLARVRRFRVA